MASIADVAFASENLTMDLAWLGAIAYTLQIFFDFSGYSDMAIGLGKMFGFHFLENFDYPYVSKSISEFWRRWHISLGSWFRDYGYFPLGGSRVDTKIKLVFNLLIVWFLTGVWHGANWTFIVWGLMYFVLIAIEKLTGFEKKLGFLGHIYTMFFVVIGWVIFRSENIIQAITYIKSMFSIHSFSFINQETVNLIMQNKFYIVFGIVCSLPFIKLLDNYKENILYKCLRMIGILVVFIVSISFIVKGAYNPFIYFNF